MPAKFTSTQKHGSPLTIIVPSFSCFPTRNLQDGHQKQFNLFANILFNLWGVYTCTSPCLFQDCNTIPMALEIWKMATWAKVMPITPVLPYLSVTWMITLKGISIMNLIKSVIAG